MNRAIVVLAVLLCTAVPASAQIIRPVLRTRPIAWTSLSVGWFQQSTICDPDSDACWNFGGAPQFRGTLEMPVGNTASVGVAATTSRAPLTYAGPVLGPGTCGTCDATANVTQVLGNFRIGGGTGFHQVIDLVAGTTMYTNFRSEAGGRLGRGTVSDLTFGLGYGFGYSISPRTQFVLVQEWALVIHERRPGSPENTAQQQTIRIGGRFALGEKR